MTDTAALRSVAPDQLGAVRHLAHKAVQHLTRAARANLPAAPDDSHSSLSWHADRLALISQPIDTDPGPLRIGVSIADFELFVLRGDLAEPVAKLDGLCDADVTGRLDDRLRKDGLVPTADIALPYDLPRQVESVDRYALAPLEDAAGCLAAWYSLAASVLAKSAAACRGISPGPSPVRCWPHHFDIAYYLSLKDGDPETASGIGVGMSPGDDSYDAPYFYVNPWPSPDPKTLPDAPRPGHWHTEGFVGAIAPASEILTLPDVAVGVGGFVENALAAGRQALGD